MKKRAPRTQPVKPQVRPVSSEQLKAVSGGELAKDKSVVKTF